ncbi:class F sortase [Streptomyces sp. NPDC052036]|uniref:class F sortase n=1 Tax=unclassified Streptomyces TaxID=2593676 RepID=UPI00342C89DC
MGVAWVVLLLGLWMWGRGVSEAPLGISAPTTGDMAAAGRPPDTQLPPGIKPLGKSAPLRVDIPSLGVRAPVVTSGLDAQGAIEPPPFGRPGVVGWYGNGVTPGASGTALVVGHVDTDTGPAVFYKLSSLRQGTKIRVVRGDGRIAEFTVESIRVLDRDRFDAQEAYGTRQPGRAELRLITCGGTFDRASGAYTANVVVSAYLTGVAR